MVIIYFAIGFITCLGKIKTLNGMINGMNLCGGNCEQ